MDSAVRMYDMYDTMLENILQDRSEPAVSLPLEFFKAVTDNFSNDRIIGRGGFGVVYKGILRSGKVIAVKKIYDRYHVDKDNSLDELSNVLGIMHPNVVQLIGYCAETKMDTMTYDDGKLIVAEIRSRLLCFEYISNGSLDMYISKEYLDLGWDEIYMIIKGICSGLVALHEEKIVHLDLKPQNILMDGNMMPKIVDFGLARLLGENKTKIYTGRATGTTGYMAPEYFNDGKISTKADIYSLGVIMIELMTGSRNYPRSMPHYYYSYTSFGNSLDTTQQAKLEEFTGTVLEKWKKIFQKTLKDASLIEVSTHQLKQLIAIALKCVDSDLNKRPNATDILQNFDLDEAGQSSRDPSSKYSQQVRDLVSVQPTELKINMADPNKLYRSSCLLHLNNNTLGHVAYRIMSNTLARHFIWPSFGFVPPGCRYTVVVTMRYQQNPPPSEDLVFTLESTRASDQEIKNVISRGLINNHDDFFAKAKDKGRQVHEEKLTPVYANNEIVPLKHDDYMTASIDAHPTEPWILIIRSSIMIWDYNTQEMSFLPAYREQKQASQLSDTAAGSVRLEIAKFIPQKNWIVVGCSFGYIKVYKYSKQALFSEIKSFKAHEYGDITSLELHQIGPYVLSAVEQNEPTMNMFMWDNPMDKIKMWDWENDWKLICTFNTQYYTRHIRFNPMDVNMFATTTAGGVKVWNTCSPDSVSELRRTHPICLDFFSLDGAPHLIFTEQSNRRKPTIWDYQNMKCVTTLKQHVADVRVVFSHPELPVLVTGSNDGTIRLWNSSTFSLLRVLNCGLGLVMAITSLKGSKRIAILHYGGLAIAEIDTEQPVGIL